MSDARFCPLLTGQFWSPGELCFVWLPVDDLSSQVTQLPSGWLVIGAPERWILGDLRLSVEERYVLSCSETAWCLWYNRMESV